MRLHDLEDEEVVFADQPVVVQAAFEARVAFGDQRRADALGLLRREPEMFELVDLGARGVADPDDDVRELGRRQVDHAFPALADHLEAVVRRAPKISASTFSAISRILVGEDPLNLIQ